MTLRDVGRLAGLLLAAGCAACAVESPTVQSLVMMPSYFDTLSCPELVVQHQMATTRVKELATLREKSGNAVVNALAYDSEYAAARGKQAAAEQAAAQKGCDLTKKPEPPKPAPAVPEAKRPQR